MSTLGEQQGARVNELNNGIVQQGVPEKYLQKAVVTLPSGNVTNFFVHKKSKGNVLTDLVSEHEGLLEKDYFGLNYVDHFGEKTWLYPDKRIAKQLNKEPWNFTLRVKFYAPEPSVLADDLTRYLLYLQVRKDVYDETLPTSYPTKILLAAIVMQAETGDFETTEQSPEEYDQFVRNARLVPSVDQEFLAKVREAHKEQKGLTTQEAHLKYLDAAKALAKYGYTFFQGKDVKNGNVTIGIHAHGITVYKDQVQIHKFLWQSIEKIQYSSNKFSILLKPGELDEKKQVTVRYSMPDYYTAKRLYRTAVEHHTFFRLIRPEDPPKSGLLSRVGSEHFRYQGRTYFQAKMASQMFDNPTTTVQRTPSGRQVSRSVDDLAIQRSFPASPLHYADESTHQATSPEKSKSYSLSSKHKDERTPLSVVVHETNGASPGSKRSSTSSASIVSPFSGEYIVSSRPYTPRDEATTSPYEDVVFPLAISPSERQRNVRTPTKSSASTSQRNSRVRFFDGPVTPDDGSAVAMAPAGKPGKRTAKRRLFGPVNDDHTAFAPVDDLYRSPEIVNVPLDSKVSVYDRGWYTATLPSTSAQQSVPFFVCCKPTKAVRREFDILRDFDNGIIDQSNLHKRSELDSYPLRYYSSVYHSGLPPTKRRKWVVSKDEDVIPADRLNPEYYVFGSEHDYSPERFERVTEAENVPLRQVSRVYWHGGLSKPNTKVVEVAPESRIVRTTTTQQRTAPSTSTETVERSFVEHDLPVHEVKTTTVERSGQPGDEYTITTTRIETTTILESEAQPSTSEERVPPPQIQPIVKERVSSSRYPVITEAYTGPIDVIPKSRDLDLLPIKRFANVYHPGISEERVTPITWIRKQKTSLLDRRRDSNRPTISETSESSFHSKSTHHEKIVSRKRLHSLSQHYPVIGEAYEGPVTTISPTTEAESANLFDCVSFASVDEAGPSKSPTDKKASRSSKYSLPRCVCGWCGPQERHLIEDQYPYDVEPYTGPVENLKHDGQLSHAELETCVSFQVEEKSEHVEEEPEKVHVVQEIPTINIHEEPSLHESDTDEDIPAISGVEYDMSINMHKPNDVAYAECVIEIPAPRINVTFESRSEEVYEHRSTVATETTIIREKVESDVPDNGVENVKPVSSSVVIERRPSSPVPTESQPIHVIDYELSRIDSRRVKFDPETSKPAHPRAELITEEVSYPVHEPLSQQRRPASAEGCGLFCGANKKAIQEDPYDVNEHPVTTKQSSLALSKNYPVIGERFEGEHADLSHQPEAKSADLFDTISFVSSSEDSGVGGDTTAQRPKPKKTGLKCLWCGPSKSQRKTSEESLKVVNVHEQQVQRRSVTKKAKTYDLSDHYPAVEAYSGETVPLNKTELAPEANLFDLIDFIPSESETGSLKDLKRKKSGLKCLWCGTTKPRGDQTDLTKRRSNGKCVPLNCLAKQSNESRYPVDAEPYVGPVFELERPAEAPSANLFDTISFATDDEDRVSLQLHNNGDLRRASSEAHEPAPIINVPEVRQESAADKMSASKENVNMVFVHKVQSNEPTASTSYVVESASQQQIAEDANAALYKHMDDVVDFAVPSTSHEVEEPFVAARTPTPPTERQVAADKGCGLWCGGRNKAVDEPYAGTRRLSHHESIVKAKTLHSLSKNYPVIGERFEGELAELPHQPEAKSVDLFDTISFVSSSEDSGVGGDTTAQRPKPKKTGLKCLWCGPSKSQRKTSEESLKVVNVHEQQVQRRNVIKKAETYALSEHYPVAEEAHSGEVIALNKAELAPEANLFDVIDFVPSTEDVVVKQRDSDSVHGGLRCIPCVGKSSKKPIERRPSHHESIVKAKTLHSLSKNYPVIGERFEGELAELPHQPEAKSVDLFDTISFVSGSEDSGVGGDTTAQRPKPKKTGLKCLWCGPSKSQRKTSEESLKVVNVHEQQVQRNRFVRKARTYSTSEHYPSEQVPYEGEVFEVVKVNEIPAVNLFDTISFAPSTDEEENPAAEPVHKKKSPKCGLLCAPCLGRRSALPEVDEEPERLVLHHDLPSVEEPVAKVEVRPVTPVEITVTKREIVVETPVVEVETPVVEVETPVVEIEPPVVVERIERVVKKVEIETVQRPREPSISAGYPVITEPYSGSLHDLQKDYEAPGDDLFEHVEFVQPSIEVVDFAVPSTSHEVEEPFVAARTPTPPTERQVAADKGCGLWCGGRNKTVDEPYAGTRRLSHHESIVNAKKVHSLSKNYPVIGERFEGELAELPHQPETKSVDLFDTISFVSSSEDSGVGGDTTAQRPKPKKTGLKCLWCGPSKSQRKTSEESLKVVNVHEQQVQRNRFVRKARTYSTSEHYPAEQVPYEGEVFDVVKANEIPAVNLFDTISFAPSTDEEEHPAAEPVHKKKSPKCGLLCAPCLGRRCALPEVDEEPERLVVHHDLPSVEEPVAKVEVRPVTPVEITVTKREIVVETPVVEVETPVVEVERVVKKVEIETVQRPREPSISAGYPVITEPYSGSLHDLQKDYEAPGADLFEHVEFVQPSIEVVDFAVPSTSHEVEEPFVAARTPTPPTELQVAADKGCGLWCGGRNKAVDEPYAGTRRLSHHESIVKAKKVHSLSKNYPVIGERFEGELAELPHQPEAKSVDLFDTISFVSSSEDSGVGGDTTAQRPKPKKTTGLKCLWCGPSKSQRKTSEESLKVVNVHEQQVQRRNVIKKAETYALSEHYPVAEEAHSGEVIALNKAELAPEANLFDVIDFVPSTEDVVVKQRDSDSVHGGLRCIPCVGKSSKKPIERRPSHHESIVKAKTLHSLSKNYPVIGERFEGELAELPHQPEAKSVDLFDTISFVSSSEDSGVGGDTTAQRPKPKKTGLKCLWCGPSKSQRKTSEESLKVVNVHEQQVQRNRFVRKARTYSTSEHYPAEQVPYEGEVFDVVKANEIPAVNLFDTISFAPSTDEEEHPAAEPVHKKKSPKCGLLCAPCLGRRCALPEVDEEPERLVVHHDLPSVEEPVAKVEVRPVTPVEITVTKREIVVETPVVEVETPVVEVETPVVEVETPVVEIEPPVVVERIERVVKKVEIETVQRPREPSISAGYPVITEPYSGSLHDLQKDYEAPGADLFEHVEFVQPSIEVVDFAVPSTSHEVEEPFVAARTPTPPTERQVAADKCCGLWCGGRNKAVDEPYAGTRRLSHHESIVKAKKVHSLSKNYPVIGERFEGELAELPHQPEAKSVDLFDTISFVSSSEDSGVGGDTTAQRPKPKKTRLKCLWCGPSKSQRKTSEESLKVVNVHEQQVQRNRFVRKARTYSTSEHYPAEQVPYEGEVFDVVKANEIPAVNLFDTISFAPSTDEEEHPAAEPVHKKKSPKCGLLCAPCLGRRCALPEVDEEPERLVVHHDLPSVEEPVAKVEVRPVTPVEITVTKREIVVETPVVEVETPVVEVERVVKKVEIETVQRPREPSISAGYPVITEPYSGSLHDLQKDYEAPGADLFEHVEFVQPSIEVVDFAVPSTSHEVEEPFVAARTPTPPTELQVAADKGCGLWCGGRNKAVDEPYAGTRRLSHHESIVKAKKVHSLSKNYPVIGERFEGELAELPHQPEAKSVDLFDTISFVSSSEDSGVGGDTTAQRPKPKKTTGLKCLWCGPSKSQRKTSEESLKVVNVHEQQVQRRNVVKKAETYALSEHYPVAEAYSGEVVSLNKAELAPEANLFDLIEFVPSSIKATTTSSTDNVQGGFRCIPCVGKTPRDLTDRQILFNQTAGYPAISEPYTGEVDVLTPNVEASSADLFDCVEFAPSDEVFAQSGYNKDTLKSKTSTLEKESGTVRRLRLFTKSRAKPDVFTTSGSYPGYFVYEGPVEDVKRTNDFETTPLRQSVNVYHSGKPFVVSKFTRERLPGIEEVGEPTGSYAVCEIREGETVSLHAFASLDTVPLAEHAKRPVVSQSEKIPSGKFKRKYSKTRNVADADADSSSQSSDELPKSSFKRKREEGEGFFTFFRNRIGTRPQKKTGFEGLMVPDDNNVRSTVLEGDLPSSSIHEHVHVYHHGYSNVHQTIDSGFEDGPNASETDVKRGGTLTWRQSGRFFDKFKRGTKRPSADEAEKPESVVEVKTPPVQTHYEHLEQTPYLGLYSSTERNVDMDPIPLSTAVEHIPIGHYPGHAPVPVEFVIPTQKSVAIEHQQPSTSVKSTLVKRFSKDSRQDRDPHYAYGLSSAKFEGDHSIVNKDSDTPEHPIGEYVTVYHCGKSDVPTTPVPAEFYEVSPERTVSTQYPNSTPTSEFESIAETNVTLERSPVAAYGQVIITDSDRTEAAMTSYSIENVYEDAITSTPRADELSAEPLREQTIVYHSGRSSSRDASERNALVADTSADRERRDLVQRLLALFRRNPKILEGYPEITNVCTYEGPLAEFTRSDDLDQHDLHALANVYHSGFSDDKASKKARKNAEKQRRRALRKLKVNLNDYPHDDEPVDDAHVFNLYAIRDVPQSPAPATLPADTFYSRRSHPRHRFLRRFRRSRQHRASELAIALRDAPSRRDDYSTATFSMVISDKSLFTRGHWPVTDIDVDVVLTKQRHIDCQFETTVATKRAYDSAIAGGPALSRTSGSQESGAGSSANWCRVRQHPDGSWFAEVSATLSAVPQQKEESVDAAVEVARGTYVITEEPSFDYDVDLCSLVDIDDEVISKPGEGKSSDCGLSSKFGDSLTRLSLASDDDDNIMFSAITRRLSEKLSKKNKKEEDKRRKKEEKEAAKRAKKDKKAVAAGATKKRTSGGGDADSVSSSSSSSDSDAEHEERHVVVSQAVAGPVEPLSRNQELGDLHGIPESRQITMAPQTAAVNHVDANSSGPYTPAKDKDGRVLREETVEQVYRISGSGKVPKFDPTDMSLQAAVDKCVRETDKVPRVQMVEANILVKENEPLPQALREGSAPHTTVHTWHETEAGPEKVTTEVDKYGNKVTRTVKTQHTKHTIQKQSYQTYAIDGNGTPVPEQQTVIETTEETSPLGPDAVARSPVVHTKTRTVAYEKGSQNEPAEPHGELMSSKTITTGNRTVEILTYKTEKDGVIETRVEHRVTIHSGSDIDHDAELAKALLEATEMSPDLLINRVEVEKSTQN